MDKNREWIHKWSSDALIWLCVRVCVSVNEETNSGVSSKNTCCPCCWCWCFSCILIINWFVQVLVRLHTYAYASFWLSSNFTWILLMQIHLLLHTTQQHQQQPFQQNNWKMKATDMRVDVCCWRLVCFIFIFILIRQLIIASFIYIFRSICFPRLLLLIVIFAFLFLFFCSHKSQSANERIVSHRITTSFFIFIILFLMNRQSISSCLLLFVVAVIDLMRW